MKIIWNKNARKQNVFTLIDVSNFDIKFLDLVCFLWYITVLIKTFITGKIFVMMNVTWSPNDQTPIRNIELQMWKLQMIFVPNLRAVWKYLNLVALTPVTHTTLCQKGGRRKVPNKRVWRRLKNYVFLMIFLTMFLTNMDQNGGGKGEGGMWSPSPIYATDMHNIFSSDAAMIEIKFLLYQYVGTSIAASIKNPFWRPSEHDRSYIIFQYS